MIVKSFVRLNNLPKHQWQSHETRLKPCLVSDTTRHGKHAKSDERVRTCRVSGSFQLGLSPSCDVIEWKTRPEVRHLRVCIIANWSVKSRSQDMFDTKWLERIVSNAKPHTFDPKIDQESIQQNKCGFTSLTNFLAICGITKLCPIFKLKITNKNSLFEMSIQLIMKVFFLVSRYYVLWRTLFGIFFHYKNNLGLNWFLGQKCIGINNCKLELNLLFEWYLISMNWLWKKGFDNNVALQVWLTLKYQFLANISRRVIFCRRRL